MGYSQYLAFLGVSLLGAPAPPPGLGLAEHVAPGLPCSTLRRAGRDAQSSAFFSWPGAEPLYTGVAVSRLDRSQQASHRQRSGSFLEILVEMVAPAPDPYRGSQRTDRGQENGGRR